LMGSGYVTERSRRTLTWTSMPLILFDGGVRLAMRARNGRLSQDVNSNCHAVPDSLGSRSDCAPMSTRAYVPHTTGIEKLATFLEVPA